jgi:uncharacterized protein YndB with AHSA1/START domain
MVSSTQIALEKQQVLRAPVPLVWKAISDSEQFGAWFKARFREPFIPGTSLVGEFTEPGFIGRKFVLRIEEVVEPRLLSFRWRPQEFDRPMDDFSESTLVEFRLEADPEGTLLTIRESGFENIPESQRSEQLRGNSEGWDEQLGRIGAYVSGTDRIEKRVKINAPMERVWAVISTASQFGEWFGLDTMGAAFAPGKTLKMKISNPGEYHGMEFAFEIVSVEAGRYFAYRWHPFAVDKSIDYSSEPTTLVEFLLEPAGEGTVLTVTESGFNAIPESRRALAFEMDEGGWAEQVERVRRYVGG